MAIVRPSRAPRGSVTAVWLALLGSGCAGSNDGATAVVAVAAPVVSSPASMPAPTEDASIAAPVSSAGLARTPEAAPLLETDSGTMPGRADAAERTRLPSIPAVPTPGQQPPPAVPAPANHGMALLQARASECYRVGVAADPNMSGDLVIDIKLLGDGSVEWTKVKAISGVSDEVAQCITHAIMTVSFDAPSSPIILETPLKFVNPARRK